MGPGDKPRGRQRCVCVCKRAGARATGRVEAPTALSAAEMVALDVERGVRAGGEVLCDAVRLAQPGASRSEEHTSELQSLMRISYAVFCLKTKKQNKR